MTSSASSASAGPRLKVSTNFSQRDYDETYLASLVESGLSLLIVSIDGATQETYERYRVRGNLERVLGNMKRLAAVKRALRREQPEIFFKMLLNRYNQDEVDEARHLAEACGAAFLLNEKFWCPDDHRQEWAVGAPQVPSPLQARALAFETTISSYCRQLWDSVIVTANGDVHPCCLTYEAEHAIGNLALLEKNDNSALNSAVFEVKRHRILDLDRRGSYLPICTRNVFLKYYTQGRAQQLHFWSPQDRGAYHDEIERVLAPYLKPEVVP